MMIWCRLDIRAKTLLSGFACLCLLLAGCGGGSKTPADGAKSTTGASTPTDSEEELSAAGDLLKTILDMLTLEALGFTAEEESVVGLVNQWQRQTQNKDSYQIEEPLDAPTQTLLQQHLSSEQIAELRRTAFNRLDIRRIRDQLLMNGAVKNSVQKFKFDQDRVVAIFQNLVRNSDLVAKHEDDLPLSAFSLTLLGKLTVAERTWLFSDLLRQLKIDCVLLTSASAQNDLVDKKSENGALSPFLIGVLVNEQVYLFDPLLGMPLMAPGETGKVPSVATLAQVRSDPNLLHQFDIEGGKPYRITEEILKSPRVLLCGDPEIWSYRFHRLQSAFTGDRNVVISDSLTDRDGHPGVLNRVANWPGKHWQLDQIGVWTFPATHLFAVAHQTAEQRHRAELTIDPLRMPLKSEIIKVGEKTEELLNPTNQFLLARMEHARGHLSEAVKGYTLALTRLQNPNFRDVPQRFRVAYVKAMEDIRFWISVSKFEQGETRIATDKLRLYLRTYPQGEWSDATHAMLAEVLAEGGNFAGAIEEISKVTPDHPQSAGFAFQKQKWTQALKSAEAAKPKPDAPAETKVEK
jgi:hypothetical protein